MMYTNKQLLQLTLPLFAEQFLIVFVGVADTFMVSYAGEAAVSGVALVVSIFDLLPLPFDAAWAAIVLCGLFSDPIITLLAKLSAGVM